MPTAILVDGGFVLRRYRAIFADTRPIRTAKQVAEDFHKSR